MGANQSCKLQLRPFLGVPRRFSPRPDSQSNVFVIANEPAELARFITGLRVSALARREQDNGGRMHRPQIPRCKEIGKDNDDDYFAYDDEEEDVDYSDDEEEDVDFSDDEEEDVDFSDDEEEDVDYSDDDEEDVDYSDNEEEDVDYSDDEEEDVDDSDDEDGDGGGVVDAVTEVVMSFIDGDSEPLGNSQKAIRSLHMGGGKLYFSNHFSKLLQIPHLLTRMTEVSIRIDSKTSRVESYGEYTAEIWSADNGNSRSTLRDPKRNFSGKRISVRVKALVK
ncbi:hypothetical protein RRG08_008471 [Elysia crispata]|uniref:Uncharacterized protein n=1 Tax=Elysia crispata TaxID=231223 RepID=A0AAE0Z9Q2_9GAST|nr:hypothetical protein RRG08_008471 [Elysia crispata]